MTFFLQIENILRIKLIKSLKNHNSKVNLGDYLYQTYYVTVEIF